MKKELTILEAFETMKCFLEQYYERGKRQEGEIGQLLGDLQFLEDSGTADPAQWHDWEKSVEKVLKSGYTPSKLEMRKPDGV